MAVTSNDVESLHAHFFHGHLLRRFGRLGHLGLHQYVGGKKQDRREKCEFQGETQGRIRVHHNVTSVFEFGEERA